MDDVERFRERRRAREEEARREAEQRRLDEERAEQLRQKALDPLLRPNMQRDMPHWFNEHAKNHLVLGDQTSKFQSIFRQSTREFVQWKEMICLASWNFHGKVGW